MSDTSQNNKRIAKNTLLLYIRMAFTMIVQLYTSRVVLATLGIEDYGIYNVVGGVVAMFGFLNGAMSTATQRYLTYELGKGSQEKLNRVFNTSLQIHAIIALFVFILGETIGLWFIYNKMIIPQERLSAALWVFQCSVVSTMTMIVSVPYNACIIAHEKMSAFAYISVLEVTLKLLIVYLLLISDYDKLIVYALLALAVQLLIRYIYGNYCNRHFIESKLLWIFDRKLFREMFCFAGWNLWGNCAAVLFTQGINLMLNSFFGSVVNAARAIAVQVEQAILQFSTNFQMAINPQITKTYAQGKYEDMHTLVKRSSRFTFILLFVISLPVMIEAPYILSLWLKEVPEHTVAFMRIILTTTIIDSMARPLMQAAAATGNVRRYQSVVGGILLMIVPFSYIALKAGAAPESVFIVHLLVCILAFIVRLYIIRPMIYLGVWSFIKDTVVKAVWVILLSIPVPLMMHFYLEENFLNVLLICVLSVVIAILFSYLVGLNKNERVFVGNKLKVLIRR